MADTQPIPVRLSSDLVRRLDEAAAKIGTNRAGIVRFCVETWLRHFEINGKASLPINWDELMAAQDHRTTQSHKPIFISSRSAEREAAVLNEAMKGAKSAHPAQRPSPSVGAPNAQAYPRERGSRKRSNRPPAVAAAVPIEPKDGRK